MGVATYSRSEEESAVKKSLTLAIVALVVPGVALAGKPNPPGRSQDSHGKAAPTVLYILKGTLTNFQAANPTVSACPNGSVTIEVKRVNHQRAVFRTLTQPLSLSFCVSTTTEIVVEGGGELASGVLNDMGIVKVRYAKKFDPADSAQLALFEATAAKQIIDKRPLPTS
jgi:hypothetical protein